MVTDDTEILLYGKQVKVQVVYMTRDGQNVVIC